jgi:hypothetical protein
MLRGCESASQRQATRRTSSVPPGLSGPTR